MRFRTLSDPHWHILVFSLYTFLISNYFGEYSYFMNYVWLFFFVYLRSAILKQATCVWIRVWRRTTQPPCTHAMGGVLRYNTLPHHHTKEYTPSFSSCFAFSWKHTVSFSGDVICSCVSITGSAEILQGASSAVRIKLCLALFVLKPWVSQCQLFIPSALRASLFSSQW